MKSKDFLLSECKNLGLVLDETLRYEYGLDGSREFYEECDARLQLIKDELNNTDEENSGALSLSFYALESLSALICRIERSSLGEYSWPFVEEFKEISEAVCTEPTSLKPSLPPKVHVLSEGGLSSYQIDVEANRSFAKKRILTIFFPRTLKHFVLLHTILGHEIGHAIFSFPKFQGELTKILRTNLIDPNDKFCNHDAVVAWLYSSKAPNSAQVYLSLLKTEYRIDPQNFFQSFADYDAWVEEFLCDFIGLLMFGPSFLAALCDLLYSTEPSGAKVGQEHPPTGCRVNMLIVAAQHIGYDQITFDAETKPHVDAFWASIYEKHQNDAWFDVFSEEQIKNTTNAIMGFLSSHAKALYPMPSAQEIKPLVNQIINQIPPVGYRFTTEKGPEHFAIDFRHTLYAGWIAASNTQFPIPFDTVNRLCEHGIMQQRAIKEQIAYKIAKEAKNTKQEAKV